MTPHARPGWPLPNVWLGVSIESDAYTWRAKVLSEIPAAVRFVSAEPLLGPLPSLSLSGITWLIVGGESGGPRKRYMDHAWARELRDKAVRYGCAFFFKQSSGPRPEMGTALQELDGSVTEWHQYPRVVTP